MPLGSVVFFSLDIKVVRAINTRINDLD